MAAEPEPLFKNDNTMGWAERWLSPVRLPPYLAARDGDVEDALDLYL